MKRPYMSVRHQLELYRFGSTHISKLLLTHADALTVGAYLKYPPPVEISVRKFVDEFYFISTIHVSRFGLRLAVTQLKYGLTWNLFVPNLSSSLP